LLGGEKGVLLQLKAWRLGLRRCIDAHQPPANGLVERDREDGSQVLAGAGREADVLLLAQELPHVLRPERPDAAVLEGRLDVAHHPGPNSSRRSAASTSASQRPRASGQRRWRASAEPGSAAARRSAHARTLTLACPCCGGSGAVEPTFDAGAAPLAA
jgi:hypothetical protein